MFNQFVGLSFLFTTAIVGMQICGNGTLALSSPVQSQRIALVTGANKGIGKEIARKLASKENTKGGNDDDGGDDNGNGNGNKSPFLCILGCRNEKLGLATVQELKAEGLNVAFVRIDLQDTESIQTAAQHIEEKYGRCDVLINNAAVCFNDPTLYGRVDHTPFAEQASITVSTNFFGTLCLTKAMLPLLKKSILKSPRIINIASSAGRLAILPSEERREAFSSPDLTMEDLESFMKDFIEAASKGDGTHTAEGWPNTGYGVSKVGIIAMTKILARENPTFMVNSVDPGYCATDQNNNQGFIPAERGAVTPFLLATLGEEDQSFTGVHWYEEQEIPW